MFEDVKSNIKLLTQLVPLVESKVWDFKHSFEINSFVFGKMHFLGRGIQDYLCSNCMSWYSFHPVVRTNNFMFIIFTYYRIKIMVEIVHIIENCNLCFLFFIRVKVLMVEIVYNFRKEKKIIYEQCKKLYRII